jgi:hypothetical protein
MTTNNNTNKTNYFISSIDDYTSGDISIEKNAENNTEYMIMIFLLSIGFPILMMLLAILLAYKKQRMIKKDIALSLNNIT